MTTAFALFCALILDAVFGEPKWVWSRIPHPAVLMGRIIGWADTRFNIGARRKAKGALLLVSLVTLGGTLGTLITFVPYLDVVVSAILLAHKSLIQHVKNVAIGLEMSEQCGRDAVAMIVGRDTTDLDAAAIARAAIESAAENFSDGVVAPAFWFLIGGLPGLMIYKMVNTADSMVGYLTPKHADFGWASARFDDLLNLIPARLTMLLLLPLGGHTIPMLRTVAQDAAKHRSPNAGWPEAALSRALGVALSGPRAYHGKVQHYDWVNAEGRKNAQPHDIYTACRHLWLAWAMLLLTSFILAMWSAFLLA